MTITKELEEIRKLLFKLIKDTNNDKETLEKANEISKLTNQYCRLIELQRGEK